jgi:hypothetical protein
MYEMQSQRLVFFLSLESRGHLFQWKRRTPLSRKEPETNLNVYINLIKRLTANWLLFELFLVYLLDK